MINVRVGLRLSSERSEKAVNYDFITNRQRMTTEWDC